MTDILTGTPSGLTYDHDLVRHAWFVCWIVSTGVLGLVIGWMGLTLIVGEHLGRQSIGWKEMVPRLCLGLAAAAASLWWCSLVIDLADSISGYVAAELNVQPGDLVRGPLNIFVQSIEAGTAGMGLFLAAVYLVYGLFVLIIVVQLIIRLALIDVLLALAPVGLGLWILPHTAGWGRHWLRLFMVTVMQQSVQLLAIAFGFGFLQEFAAIATGFEPAGDLIWKLLMSAAFMYLATRVPSMLGNAGTFDAWVQTLFFSMAVVGGIARSAKGLTMLASGGAAAAAGPVGMAAAAGGAALGAVTGVARSAADISSPPDGGGGQGGSPRSAGE